MKLGASVRTSGVFDVDRFNGKRASTGRGAQRDTGLNGAQRNAGFNGTGAQLDAGLNGTRGSTGPGAQQTCTFVNI